MKLNCFTDTVWTLGALYGRGWHGAATTYTVIREERTCLHCEGGVDDEEHFLWACTTHDGIKEELFRKLETHNKPDMLLALRTPANRRPVHAIKWVMQYGFAELACGGVQRILQLHNIIIIHCFFNIFGHNY